MAGHNVLTMATHFSRPSSATVNDWPHKCKSQQHTHNYLMLIQHIGFHKCVISWDPIVWQKVLV